MPQITKKIKPVAKPKPVKVTSPMDALTLEDAKQLLKQIDDYFNASYGSRFYQAEITENRDTVIICHTPPFIARLKELFEH